MLKHIIITVILSFQLLIAVETDNIYISTSFTPPFLYSYQCSTALFKHFLPILIFQQAILAFIRPFLWFLASNSNNYYIRNYSFLPRVLWPEENLGSNLFNRNQAITEMTHQITLFLTFGLVSPILAFLIVITLGVYWLMWSIVVKRSHQIQARNLSRCEQTPKKKKRGMILN